MRMYAFAIATVVALFAPSVTALSQAVEFASGGPDEAPFQGRSVAQPTFASDCRKLLDEDELGDQGKSDCQRFRDACAPIGFDVRRCRKRRKGCCDFFHAKMEPLKPKSDICRSRVLPPAPREDACSTRQAGPLICLDPRPGAFAVRPLPPARDLRHALSQCHAYHSLTRQAGL